MNYSDGIKDMYGHLMWAKHMVIDLDKITIRYPAINSGSPSIEGLLS